MRVAVSRCGSLLAIVAITLLGGGGIATVAVLEPGDVLKSGDVLLRVFAVVVLASLPGWLFVRFLGIRAVSLWTEYVLNLHRLGVDGHENLPEPPEASSYHDLWKPEDGTCTTSSTIYHQKFEAYYGVAAPPEEAHPPLPIKTLPPVLLGTAVLAVGWTAVLFDTTSLTASLEERLSTEDALRFAFMGSYVFIIQMLLRRFFQSDLKPSAYFGAVARIATVLIVVLAVHHAAPDVAFSTPGVEVATAFLIGFFPLLGMQIIHAVASVAFRKFVPTLKTPYPLSDLDGMNIWYEARLMEEGIEDLENLVTGNLVDILLRTRVPVGRLVDWIDQAALLLVLEPVDPAGGPLQDDRSTLRRLGVRTATDLETMFLPSDRLERRAAGASRPHGEDEPFQLAMAGVLDRSDARGPSVVPALLRSFSNLPNLVHVRHWRDVLCAEHHGSTPALEQPPAQPALPPAAESVDEVVLPTATERAVVVLA